VGEGTWVLTQKARSLKQLHKIKRCSTEFNGHKGGAARQRTQHRGGGERSFNFIQTPGRKKQEREEQKPSQTGWLENKETEADEGRKSKDL